MRKAHKIRLYPTKEQATQMLKTAGAARYTYNWGLARWEKEYREGNKPSFYKLDAIWSRERPAWSREVCRASQTRALMDLGSAYDAFFKKNAKKPKFHKKGTKDCFYVTNTIEIIKEGRINLPKIGRVKLAESLRFEGKILFYNVSTYAGEWYVSVVMDVPDIIEAVPSSVCGVDVGLEKHPAYASDGTKMELPLEKLKRLDQKLRKAQRALSRSQRNSHNRAKRLIKKQKVQQRINNIRQDVTHKFTTAVCKSHATVVIEDLNIEGMLKKAKYKAIRRAFGGSLMRTTLFQLSYKAKHLIKAPRFYPSSKMCYNCGAIKPELDPSIRTYKCPRCGAVIDRDYNAALNLMKLGLVKPE